MCSLSQVTGAAAEQRRSVQWVQSSGVLGMPCLPEPLPLEMHHLLCSWVRNLAGFHQSSDGCPLVLLGQLMKQSHWCNENVG